MRFLKRISRFISKVIASTFKNIIKTVKDLIVNIDSIALLTIAAIGMTKILSDLPFSYSLPLWIETPLVIPIISVFTIYILTQIITWRTA